MAKISVEIALNGGAEIEKQLAGIGEAGQKAFLDISKAAEQAGGFKNLKPEEVTKKLQDMGVTGVDALKKIQDAVQSASRLESVVQGVQKVEAAFGSAGEGSALRSALLSVRHSSLAVDRRRVLLERKSLRPTPTSHRPWTARSSSSIKLRLSLESAGISAQGISAALAGVKSGLDKMALQRVASDFKTLETGVGNTEGAVARLTEQAKQFTPAGNAATKALMAPRQVLSQAWPKPS